MTGPPGYLKGTATPAKVERTLDFSPFQHASLPIVVRARMLSCFGRIQLFATLWTIAPQAPLFMGFSKQEYWSGLPYSPPGDLPNLGIQPGLPALQADSLPADLSRKPQNKHREQKDEA